MPRISYLDKSKNGYDDTETTVAQIEEKVAEITALLRGLIDEENLLQYSDDTTPINIPPSNVLDMPLETRPLEHCMKFFGNLSGETHILETLWEPLVELLDKNPNIAMVGGKTLEYVFADESQTAAHEQEKTIEIEIPTNYKLITYRDLYSFISESNADIKRGCDSDFSPIIDGSYANIEEFMEDFKIWDVDLPIAENWYFASEEVVNYSNVEIRQVLSRNTIELKAHVSGEAGCYVQYSPYLFCRVLP